MRILLATEGESDEVVAERLVRNVIPDAVIQPKRMPARGIAVVLRLLKDIVRAAHFGFFDLLILHFDLDDTLLDTHQHSSESRRWFEIQDQVAGVLKDLSANTAGRAKPLETVLMTPAQSTDAWLRWAVMNGDGKRWEKKDRHELKIQLYGNPPRGLVKKSLSYVDRLVHQMTECDQWPRSLRDFHDALETVAKGQK